MANEAVLRDRISDPIDFTVADGTGIEKGALLALTDPRTAIAATTKGQVCAGIAAMEKIASDGRTRLSVYRSGIFDVTASGAITVGTPVILAGASTNKVEAITLTGLSSSGAAIIGHALETASDAEVFQIQLNLQ